MTQAPRSSCPLASVIPDHPDVEERKADAWNDLDTLVVKRNDPRLNPIERQIIEQIGSKFYGKGR